MRARIKRRVDLSSRLSAEAQTLETSFLLRPIDVRVRCLAAALKTLKAGETGAAMNQTVSRGLSGNLGVD